MSRADMTCNLGLALAGALAIAMAGACVLDVISFTSGLTMLGIRWCGH